MRRVIDLLKVVDKNALAHKFKELNYLSRKYSNIEEIIKVIEGLCNLENELSDPKYVMFNHIIRVDNHYEYRYAAISIEDLKKDEAIIYFNLIEMLPKLKVGSLVSSSINTEKEIELLLLNILDSEYCIGYFSNYLSKKEKLDLEDIIEPECNNICLLSVEEKDLVDKMSPEQFNRKNYVKAVGSVVEEIYAYFNIGE